jgi:hypothetical protein
MFDSLIDKQVERKIRETFTVEHAQLAIENALDKADSLGNPLVNQIDDFLRGQSRWAAELVNGFILDYLLGDSARIAKGNPTPLKMRMIRGRLVRGLRRSREPLSYDERCDRVASLTDQAIIAAIRAAHQKKTGVAIAGPVGDIGEWLSSIWTWIEENWLTVLQAIAAVLGIALMFLAEPPVARENAQEN